MTAQKSTQNIIWQDIEFFNAEEDKAIHDAVVAFAEEMGWDDFFEEAWVRTGFDQNGNPIGGEQMVPVEAEVEKEMYKVNEQRWEDERINLDRPLDTALVIVSVFHLWNGTRKEIVIKEGANLNDCMMMLSNSDYGKVYVENGELCRDEAHHDGTNHFVLRMMKKGVTELPEEETIPPERFLDECTESLAPMVGEIYGWAC